MPSAGKRVIAVIASLALGMLLRARSCRIAIGIRVEADALAGAVGTFRDWTWA
jgi:hypothetical protein